MEEEKPLSFCYLHIWILMNMTVHVLPVFPTPTVMSLFMWTSLLVYENLIACFCVLICFWCVDVLSVLHPCM